MYCVINDQKQIFVLSQVEIKIEILLLFERDMVTVIEGLMIKFS